MNGTARTAMYLKSNSAPLFQHAMFQSMGVNLAPVTGVLQANNNYFLYNRGQSPRVISIPFECHKGYVQELLDDYDKYRVSTHPVEDVVIYTPKGSFLIDIVGINISITNTSDHVQGSIALYLRNYQGDLGVKQITMPDIEYNKQPTVLIAMSYPQLKSGSNEYADNVVPIIMTDTSLQFAEKMQYTTNKAKAITYGQSPIYIQVNGVIRGTQNERCKTYDNIVSSLGKLKNNLMIRVGNIIMNSYVTGMQVRETSEAQNYDLISISAVGSYYAK